MNELLIIYAKAKRNYILYKGILQYGSVFSILSIFIGLLLDDYIYYTGILLLLYFILQAIIFGVLFGLSIFSLYYNKNKVLHIANIIMNNIKTEELSVIFLLSIFIIKNKNIKENFDDDYFYSELYSISKQLKVSKKSVYKIKLSEIRPLIDKL